MLVTDAGMVTLVNELHPLKALSLMLVTDVGMSTLVNEPQSQKAPVAMLGTCQQRPAS